MKQLVSLQLKTIFRSPTPYLLVFVLLPLLYVLSSAFLPALLVLPGMIVVTIFTMTFFVFGSALFQAKNSIIFKRLDVVGLTRTKFIIGNALISICVSLIAVYTLIEFFAVLTAFVNWNAINKPFNEIDFKGEEQYWGNLLVPVSFDLFFVNDIFRTLDDAVWFVLVDLLNKAGDILLVDPKYFVAILNWIGDEVESDSAIGRLLWRFIKDITGFTEKQQLYDAIDDLIITINEGLGPLHQIADSIYAKADLMVKSFEELGHAPINYVSEGILNSTDEIEGEHWNWMFLWDAETESALVRTKKSYLFNMVDTQGTEIYGTIFYSHIAPTLSTLISPSLGWDTVLRTSGGVYVQFIFLWIAYFFFFCLTAFVLYSLMLLFVSISNNFEQYSLLSGLMLVLVFIFSGLVLPLTMILSFPAMFMFASLIPTTPLIFEIQHLWELDPTISFQAQPFNNLLWGIVYPMLVSIFVLIITTRMLSAENGKLTKKFNHDIRSKRTSLVNVLTNTVFIVIMITWYYSLIKYRIEHTEEIGAVSYPSNLKLFIPMLLLIAYTLLLFVNVVYYEGRSITFFRLHNLIHWLNAIMLFPVGVFTLFTSYASKINIEFGNQK